SRVQVDARALERLRLDVRRVPVAFIAVVRRASPGRTDIHVVLRQGQREQPVVHGPALDAREQMGQRCPPLTGGLQHLPNVSEPPQRSGEEGTSGRTWPAVFSSAIAVYSECMGPSPSFTRMRSI